MQFAKPSPLHWPYAPVGAIAVLLAAAVVLVRLTPCPAVPLQLLSSAQLPPLRDSKGTLYVLLTSSSQPVTISLYEQLQQDFGGDNVFLLYDDTWQAWPHSPVIRLTQRRNSSSPHVLVFNDTECWAVLGSQREHAQYWDQPAAVLLHRHMNETPFQHIWRFESDVRCNGRSWRDCMAGTANLTEDLVCSLDVKGQPSDPMWIHWWGLAGRLAEEYPVERRTSCFMPVARFSRRFLAALDAESGLSSGFLEVLYPQLVKHHNMTMGQLPAHDIGHVSAVTDMRIWDDATADLFSEHLDNRLYHPIKQ